MQVNKRASIRKRPYRRCERGAVLIEFALTCSLLFLLLFGIMEVGLLFNCQASLSQAAAEAARSAALGSATAVAMTRAVSTSADVTLTTNNVTLEKSTDNGVTWQTLGNTTTGATTINNGSPGDLVRATITYAHPNISAYLFTGATHTMTAQIIMRHQ